jgi:glycerol-3-phosphate acyltransferase PlsX
MTIVLDAMGSDLHPEPEIEAALTSAEMFGEEIILVGQEDLLRPRLNALNSKKLPVEIVHAADVLEMGEKAVDDSKRKPNNSMAVGLRLIKEGRGRAFVSAGNTGGVMFNALRSGSLGRMPGVLRPALTQPFPTRTGKCVVLDTGANAECRPEFLLQFALMGSLYAQHVMKVQNPRVGLIANGEEKGKGNQLVKDTYPLIEKSGLNFIGNVEGKEIFRGEVDVAVTDGFTGNVMLKSVEAVAELMFALLREELTLSFSRKVGALLVKPAFRKLRRMTSAEDIGATLLLGVDGLVFVGHGRSNAKALVSAIRLARETADTHLLTEMRQGIQSLMAQKETASAS